MAIERWVADDAQKVAIKAELVGVTGTDAEQYWEAKAKIKTVAGYIAPPQAFSFAWQTPYIRATCKVPLPARRIDGAIDRQA